MKFSNKQQILYDTQKEEPIFLYLNPATLKHNFGLVRVGKCDIHVTQALRPLYLKGLIVPTEKCVTVHLKSYSCTLDAHVIEIVQKED